jgi:hypothetical protein
MNATATARINVVNHNYIASDTDRCAQPGCYAALRCHPEFVTAVYNHTYAAAVNALPGAVSEGKLVACHNAAANKVASMFRMASAR